uniref:Pik3c2g protein n=1 Tax=Fopius arisanus TaxID=64838 RepID=A0A0C9QYD2_9HYME
MAVWRTHGFGLFLLVLVSKSQQQAKTFVFPEYPYKETSKNELLFREFEQACEESGACKSLSQQRSAVAKTRCIRECVSPSCYREIYLFDQVKGLEKKRRSTNYPYLC